MSLHQPDLAPRPLVREAPVALVCNGTTLGVMMASPDDLEDFARGFALTEGIVATPEQVEDLEILHHETGSQAGFWLGGSAVKRAASVSDANLVQGDRGSGPGVGVSIKTKRQK